MTAKYAEAIAALLLLGLSIFAWTQATGISGGARIFPLMIIYALGFLSLVYLIRSILAARAIEGIIDRGGIFAAVLVMSIIYINAVIHVGYVTSTLFFIPAVAWMVGFRRTTYIAVVTITYILAVYLLFEVVFGRPLPSELLLEALRSAR